MSKESRNFVLSDADKSLMCPHCYANRRVGKVTARISIEREMNSAIDLRDLSVNPSSLFINPSRELIGDTMYPSMEPVIGCRCKRCATQMFGLDTILVRLIRTFNQYGMYTVGSSIGTYNGVYSPRASNSNAWIEFWAPLPFWVWGALRNIQINTNPAAPEQNGAPNMKPALYLEKGGRVLVFACGGVAVLKVVDIIIKQLESILDELSTYSRLIKAIVPDMYSMYALRCFDSGYSTIFNSTVGIADLANSDECEMVHKISGVRRYVFYRDLITRENTTMDSWITQCAALAWKSEHPDNFDDEEQFNVAFVAGIELANLNSSTDLGHRSEDNWPMLSRTGKILDFRLVTNRRIITKWYGDNPSMFDALKAAYPEGYINIVPYDVSVIEDPDPVDLAVYEVSCSMQPDDSIKQFLRPTPAAGKDKWWEIYRERCE